MSGRVKLRSCGKKIGRMRNNIIFGMIYFFCARLLLPLGQYAPPVGYAHGRSALDAHTPPPSAMCSGVPPLRTYAAVFLCV